MYLFDLHQKHQICRGETKEIMIFWWKTPKMNVVTPLKGHVSMATDAQSSNMFFNLL
jgi:hypothetical protein